MPLLCLFMAGINCLQNTLAFQNYKSSISILDSPANQELSSWSQLCLTTTASAWHFIYKSTWYNFELANRTTIYKLYCLYFHFQCKIVYLHFPQIPCGSFCALISRSLKMRFKKINILNAYTRNIKFLSKVYFFQHHYLALELGYRANFSTWVIFNLA